MQTTSTPPAALSIPDACAYLSIKRTTLYKLIRDGKLAKKKIGKRTVLPRESLDNLLK